MTGRRALIAALLSLPAAAVEAQSTTQRPRRPPRRPLPASAAPQAAQPLGDPAPVPNRDIEFPRARGTERPTARLDPALIDPNEPRFGTVVDRNNLQAREDRLLRQPAPGARLRLPFAY